MKAGQIQSEWAYSTFVENRSICVFTNKREENEDKEEILSIKWRCRSISLLVAISHDMEKRNNIGGIYLMKVSILKGKYASPSHGFRKARSFIVPAAGGPRERYSVVDP